MANYDDDYDNNNDAPRRSGSVEQAKSKTQVPGVLLIILGVLTLIFSGIGLVQYPDFSKNVDEAIQKQTEQVEKNPQIPAEQKKAQIDLFKKISDGAKDAQPYLLPLYLFSTFAGLMTILGGVKFINLGSKGLVLFAAFLSMTPFTSGCCCIGLPIGIWAIIALNNQVVRDGYAALARRANSRYEE